MEDLQRGIDFVMANRAFFAFVIAAVGYIVAKVKGARKDERIERQSGALEGVVEAVEEFQGALNRGEPLATEDPQGLKKAISYKVSKGREELDAAIRRMKEGAVKESRGSLADAVKAAARAVLP